jgi:hypothetical protein
LSVWSQDYWTQFSLHSLRFWKRNFIFWISLAVRADGGELVVLGSSILSTLIALHHILMSEVGLLDRIY